MNKTVFKWMGSVVTVALVVLIVFTGFSTLQSMRNPGSVNFILGFKPMSVLTGSMSPLMEPGDLIVIKKANAREVEVGDVITYRQDDSTLVTHRVVEVLREGGKVFFRTKGDANNTEDASLVSAEALLGTLAFIIPRGGYVANFVRSPAGFVVFIILPVVLLIALEVKDLWAAAEAEEKDKRHGKKPQDHMEV